MRAFIRLLAVTAFAIGCHRPVPAISEPSRAGIALTGGANRSMIYVARTTDGVLAIDLGWWGSGKPLARALETLDATAADVRFVFLTHSHRDHIAAWPAVRRAQFHLAHAEQSFLFGDSAYGGWIPRWAGRMKAAHAPKRGELAVSTFSTDTAFLVGSDTLRAYLVPGHTSGSVVYLFRGILFLGDAVTYTRRGGFGPAKRGYSDDTRAGATNLSRLWARLPQDGVHYACTAHAQCARFTPQFLEDVVR